MKFVLLLCACAVLASALTPAEARKRAAVKKRFLASVANFFSHAADVVKDGVETAAGEIKDGVETAAHAVAGAAETAVDKVGEVAGQAVDALTDAAHTVGDAVTDAAHEVAAFASKATTVLGPILDQVAQTVGPIAKEVLDAAVQQLIQQAPEILAQLGQAGVQELATSLLTSAAGKRDLSQLEVMKQAFGELVQEGVNNTVNDVHRVVAAVDKFNYVLKSEVHKLEQALQAGHDAQAAASHFFRNALAAVRILSDANAFGMDINRFDQILPDAIHLFGDKLRGAVAHNSQKRFLFTGLVQEAVGILQEAENGVSQLVGTLETLAQSLLAPTVQNVKQIAQTLLNNASSMSSQLLTKALTVLAPFAQQLGPLCQEVVTLGTQFGLPQLLTCSS